MTMSLPELEIQLLSLAPAERAHLLERLIESFDKDAGVESAWVSEALRREFDVKSGKSKMLSGDEALARIRASLA